MDSKITTPPANALPLPPKSRIGRFSIVKELGSGSNGSVYLGHDPVIDRPVAIKTLSSGTGTSDKKQREMQFINEARAVGRLSHPHIVTIYDASIENGITFIAMEFLEGQDLYQELATGRIFTPTEVATIASKLASALAYAHEHGVIHRDIKPANIFMLNGLNPKIVDFGIARSPNRVLDQSTGKEHTLFNNNLLGTPSYMSPEQATGKAVTSSTDIYSLGAVMYEMLTGQKPFQSQDVDKLLYMITHKEAKPVHEVNPQIPITLSKIVMRALKAKPEQRYLNASKLERSLKKFLSKENRGKTSYSQYQTKEPIENRRLFWLSFTALFVALIIILLPWLRHLGAK